MKRTHKPMKTTAITACLQRMSLAKRITTAATIAKVQHRRAKLVKRFNAGNWKKYLKMYATDATLRDPDIHRITGRKNMSEYFAMLFQFAQEHSFPPMQLKSRRMLVKGKFVYDIGEYCWSSLRRGKYVHTWAFIEEDFYLISDRFTVEQTFVNDENINFCC